MEAKDTNKMSLQTILIEDCEVDYDSNLQNDHIPIKLILKGQSVIESEEISQEKHLNYSKANWTIFRKKT